MNVLIITDEIWRHMVLDENDPDEVFLDYFDEDKYIKTGMLDDEDLPKGVL